jgi:hypothetical protein
LYLEPIRIGYERSTEFKESDELLAPAMSLSLWDEVD